MTAEIWKSICGYVGYYEVSNLGRVRSLDRTLTQIRHGKPCEVRLRGKIISPSSGPDSPYLGVSLWKNNIQDGRKVHILVADSFIRKIADGEEVNHLDFDRQNNEWGNLEITTPQGNTAHSTAAGRHAKKLNEQQVLEIKYSELVGANKAALAKRFDVTRASINSIIFGHTWQRVNLSEWTASHD